ncbi:Uncharacterised protein [uncultured archaeon]|nr:Uncharacterised protein [uncultured archaeon]
MPRPQKIETTEQLRDYIRKKTNWRKMIQTLEKIAMGGYEFKNYNGQTTVAEPNLEALRLLIFYTYGKMPDSMPLQDDSATIQMKMFSELVSGMNKNKQSEHTEEEIQ